MKKKKSVKINASKIIKKINIPEKEVAKAYFNDGLDVFTLSSNLETATIKDIGSVKQLENGFYVHIPEENLKKLLSFELSTEITDTYYENGDEELFFKS